ERNIASAFAFAPDLVQARDLQEVLRLQADYIRQQMQALHEQAQERRKHEQSGEGCGYAEKLSGAKKAGLIATYCAAQYFCCIAPKGRIYRSHPGGSGVCGLRTAATRRCHTRHGSAPGADPCEAELSPPKGSLNDRGNRDDHLQVQIQGSFAGRVRYAEI